jgi:hypothetical protein
VSTDPELESQTRSRGAGWHVTSEALDPLVFAFVMFYLINQFLCPRGYLGFFLHSRSLLTPRQADEEE